jgi:hypothetical protein
MNKPDLLYVRELLASTEALFQEVAAAIREAQRLQEEARALHSPSSPAKPRPRRPCPGRRGRSRCREGDPHGPMYFFPSTRLGNVTDRLMPWT